MGHTYPGATVPFGMVQLSPDTRHLAMYDSAGAYVPEVYRYCSGYQYEDTTIAGFSHTHFSGTGHSDLGDVSLMPLSGPLTLEPGDPERPQSGFGSRFRHETEISEPGYYRVRLDDPEVAAMPHIDYHNIQSVERIMQQNRELRIEAVDDAERIIEIETARLIAI